MPTPSGFNQQTNHVKKSSLGATPVTTKPFTVIWAMDPFATEDLGLQEKVADVIASLSSSHARIFPIYLLERKGLNWDGEYSTALNNSNWADEEKPAALAAIDAFLAQITERNAFQNADIRPTVLTLDESSHAKAVHQLVRFAKQVHADVIAVGSHGTSNVMQLLTGSFIEAFLKDSQLPLLVVNSKTQVVSGCCESLVFATDFSPASAHAFDAILPMARRMNAELHLFYKVPNALDPLIQGGVYMFGGGWVSIDTFVEHQNARTDEGVRWVEKAQAAGVRARWTALPDEGPLPETLAEAVIDYANQQPNSMIVVAAQSEPITSLLFGSVTKDVIRGASCPVLVVPY